MQSNTLPVFDDAQWASLLKDVDWLPSSLSSDFDFDQFLDLGLDPELAEGGASTAFGFGTSEELEQVYQGNASVSPSAELEPSSMRVSAVFNVDRLDADGNSPDFDLVASDGVHFAVNAAKLRANSLNGFNSLPVLTSSTATVPLSSTVLNLLLHTIYGISATKYTPTVDDLVATLDALEQYGLSKEALVYHPESTLFEAILLRAPSQPLECFVLAAHAGLDELAIAVSPYTLSLVLSDLSDEDTDRMGAPYLRRLFFLHLGRLEALKRIIRQPPMAHPLTQFCDGYSNNALSDEWRKHAAKITWDASPAISPISLESRLSAVGKVTDCPECLHQLDHRVKQLLVEWSLIKNTI
ncbi:hypothetical protein PENSPDRAFT_680227 [Peniophora sp. CONT]|nr:hypothetical protein PENSPDRAFT_680227 [Peniophora sp. CONT]